MSHTGLKMAKVSSKHVAVKFILLKTNKHPCCW